MSAPPTTVIVPTLGGERLPRMLDSLAAQTVAHQTIVVDNGSAGDGVAAACERLDGAEVLRLEHNAGYTRAINLGARRADGEVIVLLNDDCVCDPPFVERIAARVDAGAGVAMAAGVMRDWRNRALIDSAGMELDHTLLVFDYLNGQPISRLEGGVPDPIGPSGAAAAFDRTTFLSIGGFDERLFAYWEDVDLVLRLRRLGLQCALAHDAVGDHEHSATLGSGSRRKNYLMGFGRGYILRKWDVVNGRRAFGVIARDGVLCAGQAVVDRNLSGLLGRARGYRAAPASERYPVSLRLGAEHEGALADLRRRSRRRRALRKPAHEREGPERPLAVFHIAGTSGPSRSLERELSWLGGRGALTAVLPGAGHLQEQLAAVGRVVTLDYEALTLPSGRLGIAGTARRLISDVRTFRRTIREQRSDLVITVTSMLPAVSIAARLERVPVLVYCGELFNRGHRGQRMRGLAGAFVVKLTSRLANGIIACSHAVADQFSGTLAAVETVYPPIDERALAGDGKRLRRRLSIPAQAPLITSVGSLTEGRGQDVLVRAMPAILARHPGARCVIAGDPFPRPQDIAFRDGLLALISALGLEDAVFLVGHVEEIGDLYAAASVIVNPARASESFGRVAFEAGTAGTPSVVTRVGAVPELLRDGESAVIIESEQPAAIAAAVLRLLDDPELGARLAAGAASIARERLLPEQSLAGFQRAVGAVIAARV